MNYKTAVSLAVFARGIPFLGGCTDQHLARLGTGLAHRVPSGANAGAAAGSLISEERAGAGLLDGDLLPVGFELFGENHGQRSSHPLAHLRAGDHYRDFAFRSDRQICVGRKCAFCLRLSARGQINADDQSRSRRRGGFEKPPPGKRRHFAPPAAR